MPKKGLSMKESAVCACFILWQENEETATQRREQGIPDMALLCAATRMSPKQVKRAIRRAEKKGFIGRRAQKEEVNYDA